MSMLKIIARISLILAAALLVVGATVAFTHTSLGVRRCYLCAAAWRTAFATQPPTPARSR